MHSADCILFDLGGVLYYIDPGLTRLAFERLGIAFGKGFAQAEQQKVFNLYETGRISTEVFLQTLQSNTSKKVELEQIQEAWIALLLGMPDSNAQLVLDMRKIMPVYLLSNINEIHLDRCNKELEASKFNMTINNLFDRAFLSFEMGKRKPDADIFEEVLEEENLNPGRVLFLDDTPQNIATAEALGFQTRLITPEYPVQMALNEYGLWPVKK